MIVRDVDVFNVCTFISLQVAAQRVAAVLSRIVSSTDASAAVVNADLAIEGETYWRVRMHLHLSLGSCDREPCT
jgi:hypothetical protein